ncbi:Cro/CI family transcriptional regulator [Pseudomonas savastanoi]|uniref:Cro/CI family transcriptional regulator n=1 Tax=Pseudomonas savastanoi TaxID=29438 RepID=UPI0009BDE681|nr:Cro/CI family transcriptional regulator [Pseudomonas savastanoi]
MGGAYETSRSYRFYGSIPALAKALKITYEAVRQWGEEIPELRQYQLEKLTNGKLKAGADNASQSAA